MGEQLSLFDDEYTLLNTGVSELTRLDLDEAKKTFQRCKEMWKDSGDIDSKVKLADFLIRGFADAPNNCMDEPAYLYKLWLSFEDYVKSINFDSLVKSPRNVILRSGATKNLNDIRFFAIAQNDKRVFFRLFTSSSTLNLIISSRTLKTPFSESCSKPLPDVIWPMCPIFSRTSRVIMNHL